MSSESLYRSFLATGADGKEPFWDYFAYTPLEEGALMTRRSPGDNLARCLTTPRWVLFQPDLLDPPRPWVAL
jgi:hypothetical protein